MQIINSFILYFNIIMKEKFSFISFNKNNLIDNKNSIIYTYFLIDI